MISEIVKQEYDKVLIDSFLEEMEIYQSNHYGSYNRLRLVRAYEKLPPNFKKEIYPTKVSDLARGADGLSYKPAMSFTASKWASFYGVYTIPFHEIESYTGLIDTSRLVKYIQKNKISADIGDDESEVVVIEPVWKKGLEKRMKNYRNDGHPSDLLYK